MPDEAFGLQLFEELKREGGLSAVTSLLNYEQIQQLKSADRTGVLRIFQGSNYDFIQRMKRDSPEKLAAHLIKLLEARRQARAAALSDAGFDLMLFGLIVSD
jgi:hypothetical protein